MSSFVVFAAKVLHPAGKMNVEPEIDRTSKTLFFHHGLAVRCGVFHLETDEQSRAIFFSGLQVPCGSLPGHHRVTPGCWAKPTVPSKRTKGCAPFRTELLLGNFLNFPGVGEIL